MEKHILLNKIITDMKIASDKMALLFILGEEEIIARADADCCSHTWIENVELPVNGFPAKVISVTNLNLPDSGDPELAFYGLKIQTDKGDIIIDYRNESNGYYGGDLVWPSVDEDDYSHFYGGVYGQNISNNEWKEIV